jgi:hypothetical protein
LVRRLVANASHGPCDHRPRSGRRAAGLIRAGVEIAA